MTRPVVFDTLDGSGHVVCRIRADPDEPSKWTGTCADYQRRQAELADWQTSPPAGRGDRPETRCSHIVELHERAAETNRIKVTRHRPTPAGRFLAQHCRCGGAEHALELYTPPAQPPPAPPPAAGAPSRNRPCPCGNIAADGRPALFKWCHGAPAGDPRIPAPQNPWPANLPPPPGAVPPAPPPPPIPVETEAQRKRREAREAKELAKLEKARADRIRLDEIRKADAERREKRAAAERLRRAAHKAKALAEAARKAARIPRVEYVIRRGKAKGQGAYYTIHGWRADRTKANRSPSHSWDLAALAAQVGGRVVRIKVTPR